MATLDTTMLVDLIRERRYSVRGGPASARRRRLIASGEALMTTRINEAELRVGIYRAANGLIERRGIEALLRTLGMLELDAAAAEHFGRIKAHTKSIGRPQGDADMLIAAICLANGERLVTRNARHFADVPGLRVEDY